MDYTVYKMDPPNVSMVTAPLFTYYGELDTTVPLVQPRPRGSRRTRVRASIKQRNYPDGVHDVQYRHYDQILLDVAGYGDYLVIAWKGKTRGDPGGQVGVVRRPWCDAGHPGVGDCATTGELRGGRALMKGGACRHAPPFGVSRCPVVAGQRDDPERSGDARRHRSPLGDEGRGTRTGPGSRRGSLA